MWNSGAKKVKPHRLYTKIVLADPYRELPPESAESIKVDIECKMKKILPKMSEGSFIWRIFVPSYDRTIWHDIMPVTHHALSQMARILRNIKLNLKRKSYFTLITEGSALCVQKKRRVHPKWASIHGKNQIQLNKCILNIDQIQIASWFRRHILAHH